MGADTRHVRGCLRRIASVALAAFALASLAGCGGGPGGPSSGGILGGATGWFGGPTKIAVAPIIGTTPEVAQEMTAALVAAGKDRNLTLLPDGGKATYTLRGYLIASSEKRGSKVSYIWDVNDAQGSRVARISGDEVDRVALGQRSVERRRQCGDPQHRRQDHLATRRQPVAPRRIGERGGCSLGQRSCRYRLDARTDAHAERGEPQSRRRGGGPGGGRSRRRPAVADHGLEEAALCRRG